MRRIAVLSDTHGFLGDISWMQDCNEIWHAGDWGPGVESQLPQGKVVRGVHGNIDDAAIRKQFPEELHFESEGLRVYMRHIGGYPGHYASGVAERLISLRPHLFICGHSHILKIVRDPQLHGMWCINPGAAGRVGLHQVRTAVRLTLDQGRIVGMEVVELGPRSER
ncbi:MAG: metallophosphatase family protein [Chitinophagales bacterium]|nr:metallophosphatase family protein [Chitinophagales bacterium]MDW8427683.1 metallophosphoesterase family protein [Chitinophagales bacterium]